jgi:hypothetical protein
MTNAENLYKTLHINLLLILHLFMSKDILLDVMPPMGWMSEETSFNSPSKHKRFFLLLVAHTGSGAHQLFYSMGIQGPFHTGKVAKV